MLKVSILLVFSINHLTRVGIKVKLPVYIIPMLSPSAINNLYLIKVFSDATPANKVRLSLDYVH